jgi:hypothetical protein
MKKPVRSKFFVGLVLLLSAAASSRAQFSADSPFGVSAGLAKLFGSVAGFSAKAQVQVLDTNRQETLRTPMGFAFVEGRMRLELDMSLMQGRAVPPAQIAALKQARLERLVSIFRLDKKIVYIIFPGARSFVNLEMSKADAETAARDLQIKKTLLGNETMDGHPCTKNKVLVNNAAGATLLEATTWNATDLKDFPVQIAVQSKDNTTIIHFNQIQLVKPAPAQFEPPAGFARFAGTEALLISAAEKAMTAQKTSAAQKPKPVDSKNSTSKK